MAPPLLPQAFWFHLAVPCRRADALPPRAGAKGRLLDLGEEYRLPGMTRLEDRPPWADVRVAWSPAGLAVVVDASGGSALSFADRPEGAYGFQVWVDTRDTRNVSRATRFCHRFAARLLPGLSRSTVAIEAVARPIARAVADAPLCQPN